MSKTEISRQWAPFSHKIGPGMSHDLELLVEVPEGVGICRLTLRLRGQNLACVQGGDWYRGERFSWLNTSRLHYEPDEANVTRARLTLLGITNVGGLSLPSISSITLETLPI